MHAAIFHYCRRHSEWISGLEPKQPIVAHSKAFAPWFLICAAVIPTNGRLLVYTIRFYLALFKSARFSVFSIFFEQRWLVSFDSFSRCSASSLALFLASVLCWLLYSRKIKSWNLAHSIGFSYSIPDLIILTQMWFKQPQTSQNLSFINRSQLLHTDLA